MTVSIEKAKQEAISMVEDSISRDCMFSSHDLPEEGDHDYNNGDPETPYSIAALIACDGFEGMDEHSGISIVEEHIYAKYQQFAPI